MLKINGTFKNIFIWLLPALLLILTLFPVALPAFYSLILQIVVSLTAAYIVYLHFTEKPAYYLLWGGAFLFVLFIYNPIIHLNVVMGVEVPLSLFAAVLYITNWWFVFKTKRGLS